MQVWHHRLEQDTFRVITFFLAHTCDASCILTVAPQLWHRPCRTCFPKLDSLQSSCRRLSTRLPQGEPTPAALSRTHPLQQAPPPQTPCTLPTTLVMVGSASQVPPVLGVQTAKSVNTLTSSQRAAAMKVRCS